MRAGRAGTGRLTVALAAALLAAPAAARAGCIWSDLAVEEARVAAVRSGAPRVHFVQDAVLARGCPNEGAACRSGAYLTPGDVVLTGKTQGAYTCAGFLGARGAVTINWLPTAALVPLPEAEQEPADWIGRWTAPEQDIAITPGRDGAMAVKGSATWGDTPERRLRGGVHTGEVEGEARPAKGVLSFAMGEDGRTLPYDAGDEFTCRVRMWRRGPYLLARDNNGCGGANVSFSGFYRRKG